MSLANSSVYLEAVGHVVLGWIWLEQLLERVGRLALFDEQGRVVEEIGLPAYREVLHAPYRVIYRVDTARVVMLTLRHVRRAWDPEAVDDA